MDLSLQILIAAGMGTAGAILAFWVGWQARGLATPSAATATAAPPRRSLSSHTPESPESSESSERTSCHE